MDFDAFEANFGFQVSGQGRFKLAYGVFAGMAEFPIRPGPNHLRAQRKSLQLVVSEYDCRQLAFISKQKSHTGLTVDRNTGIDQVANIPINRPTRYTELF